MALPIVMYGSYTCEDTALVRDRFKMLGIPFAERLKEEDESVVALLSKYNAGQLRTPTLVFGDDKLVIAEPTLEQLERLLSQAGYTFSSPQMRLFNVRRYLPDLSRGALIPPAVHATQDFSRWIVFFAHHPACRVCQGYAKQLAASSTSFAELDTRLTIVLPADWDKGKEWGKEFAPTVEILVDAEQHLKGEAANRFPDTWDVRVGGTWLWLVQNNEVVRAGIYAPDAGGLAAPTEVIRFLQAPNESRGRL